MSWPASSARSTCGMTVSAKPCRPGHGSTPVAQPREQVVAELLAQGLELVAALAELAEGAGCGVPSCWIASVTSSTLDPSANVECARSRRADHQLPTRTARDLRPCSAAPGRDAGGPAEGGSHAHHPRPLPGGLRPPAQRGVAGRVAVGTPTGPHIVPVNYAVDGRVDPHPHHRLQPARDLRPRRAAVLRGRPVRLRAQARLERRGARPRPTFVDDQDELARDRPVLGTAALGHGQRNLVVRIPWTEVTGRQLGGGWDPWQHLPVRRFA